MARFRVKRPFPAKMPMRAGQIVEDPQWKDLTYLVSRGYIEKVEPVDAPPGKAETAANEEVEVEPDIIDQLAEEPKKKGRK